jgi:hypothetical protein
MRNGPRCLGSSQNPINNNVIGMGAGLSQVICCLHTHQRISLYTKSLLEPDGHFSGKGRVAVEKIAECLARYVKAGCEVIDANAVRNDYFGFQPITGVNS